MPDRRRHAADPAMLESFVSDGWHAAYMGPRPGFPDQFLAILERALDGQVTQNLPRLQLGVDTQYAGDGTVVLSGASFSSSPLQAFSLRSWGDAKQGLLLFEKACPIHSSMANTAN